jgi:hypothetical protein
VNGSSSAPPLLSRRLTLLDSVAGLVHGFERRSGPSGHETREESCARVTASLRPLGRLYLMHQVHGTEVRHAPWEGRPRGDAATADAAGVLVGVETADCLPILLVDPVRRVAAAVHAGWRGTAAGVARAAVSALVSSGSRASDLLAGLGPGIGPCCYEVGDDVRASFGPEDAGCFHPGRRWRPHLDVRAANVRQLHEAGLEPARLQHVAECTFCEAAAYHSYRREGKGGGRMISFVGFRALAAGG